jgi:uracil-DNA glycosylase
VPDPRRRYLEQLVEMGEREVVLPEARRTADRTSGPAGTASPAAAAAGPERVAEPAPVSAATREPKRAAPLDLAPGIVVEPPAVSSDLFTADPIAQLDTLDAVGVMVEGCRKCPLGHSRLNSVPGEGDPGAGFVCVGEAPGATEDETGRPFVGRAGQLLNEILKAIGFAREDVFICNVLKCRPPNNRDPEPLEVQACAPYLHRQLELIRPRVILALGRPAAHALLGSNASLGDLRGKLHRYRGIPLIVTYHPAALLRNPHWKRPTWDDVRIARRLFDGEAV